MPDFIRVRLDPKVEKWTNFRAPGDTVEEAEKYAHRIVACVKAGDGIPTELLSSQLTILQALTDLGLTWPVIAKLQPLPRTLNIDAIHQRLKDRAPSHHEGHQIRLLSPSAKNPNFYVICEDCDGPAFLSEPERRSD